MAGKPTQTQTRTQTHTIFKAESRCRQRLILAGKPLEKDDASMTESGIFDGTTLHLVLRIAKLGAMDAVNSMPSARNNNL